MVTGRQSCRAGSVKARTTAMSQPVAIATMTGHGCSRAAGSAGGSGASWRAGELGSGPAIGVNLVDTWCVDGTERCTRSVLCCLVSDANACLASDLSLAVVRLARQLRFRRPDSPVSLSQLSALATLSKEGPMTPGVLAVRERVRPPSMTRVIASLAELGFVDRAGHPDDGRQVLVSLSQTGVELIEAERRASREWLQQRLADLTSEQRETLLEAAGLMSTIVDEGT